LPYSKRPKTASDLEQLSDFDKDFHSCSKPHFSEANVLMYGNKGHAHLEGGIFPLAQEPLVGATKDIRFAKMPTFDDVSTVLRVVYTFIVLIYVRLRPRL
jgi:nuclear pore complex protein Nup98-Nup96